MLEIDRERKENEFNDYIEMDAEKFIEAIRIISNCEGTKVKFNVFDEVTEDYYDIVLLHCPHAVIQELAKAGFVTHLKEGYGLVIHA